jgi:predicted membrane channel-forming protein YqfA (hemolysin III family)
MRQPFPTLSLVALSVQPVAWGLAFWLWHSNLLARVSDSLVQRAFTAAPIIALATLVGLALGICILGIAFAVAALKRAERPSYLAYLALATNVLVPSLLLLMFRQ